MIVLSVRQKEILTGTIILGIFVGGFLFGEFGLRIMQLARFGVAQDLERSETFYIDDASGLRLPYPNQMLGRIRINNFGYRGPDLADQKPSAGIRIAFLGSSTTYDPNAAEGQAWPQVTVSQLQDVYPKCQFDHVHAGLPGFGTAQMRKYYESSVRNVDPDLVVILPGDINQDLDWLGEQQGFDPVHYRESLWAEYSVLWQKLEKQFVIVSRQRTAHQTAGKMDVDTALLVDRFGKRLNALVDAIERDGRAVALITISSHLRSTQTQDEQVRAANTNIFYMPNVAIPDMLQVREAYNDFIRSTAKRRDTILIGDENYIPADRRHYVDSMHFSPAGSAVMAERVVGQLQESPQFRSLIEGADCTADQ